MPSKKTPAEVKTTEPKTVEKKIAPQVVSKSEIKIEVPKTTAGSLSIPVLTLAGKSTETFSLPKEIFGVEVNKSLLSQAIRVYSTNEKTHWGNTKTRGEVSMTTAKVYRQKGTGNARHGAKSAPIFVKGGIALGPKFRKTILDLPKKMKKAALISALSQKVLDGEVMGFGDLDQATGKTKQMAVLFKGLEKRSVLVVNDQKLESASRAVSNLARISFVTVSELNAYEVIKHQSLLLTKAAVERLQNPKITKDEKAAKVVKVESKVVRKPRRVSTVLRSTAIKVKGAKK